jgi:hypothetical protein
MALLANGAAAVKHFVTMSAHQLLGFAMIDAHQGLVAHHDPEVSVIDDQGVGDAVQDPVQELFTRRDRIHFQFLEDLATADTSIDERCCQRLTRRKGCRRWTSDVSSAESIERNGTCLLFYTISTIYCYRKAGKAQYPARRGWCPVSSAKTSR